MGYILSVVMARGKQLPRGQRDLPSDRPAHTRTTRPIEIREVTADGIVMASVPFYEVMPKACTKRQLKWRRLIQKLGTYGNATIVYPLTEIEQELLNAMGALAVQQFED
ncbi:uncharacterized protein [Triticum aestivum]|uniref:uncharacterized protein isoform X2 n=1 Tax=Triticum aestivum TaxID=4565 RepID=UPI001D01A28B|nr:uncharacterized protein LOC123129103 isoform X2 [Triticum aestivum]